jgi:hypothetical protein
MKLIRCIKIPVVLIAIAGISSCSQVARISVNNVNETGSVQTGTFLYSLPLTVIDVRVTAEEVTIIPGPFYQYADKYLGIKNVPEKTETLWHIVGMEIGKHLEADPDYIYVVRGVEEPDAVSGIAKLLRDSLLLSARNFAFDKSFQYNHSFYRDDVVFKDLSVKRNFEVEKDVDISLVMPGADDAAPASRNSLKEKTPEQKAEEAANFLIKLKKRRFKLVAGQYEYMPAGEAMADALQELARIEEAYLSLFIGKKTVTPVQRNFSYIPVTGKESDRIVLFRFAENEGFVDSRETTGIPVQIEFNVKNKTRALEKYRIPLKLPDNQIYYRVADQAAIKLTVGEQIWAEALYPVFQCGAVVPLHVGK